MVNLLFLFMLMFSTMVAFSSSSWMVCWMMMEVSSFFFVPILYGVWSVSSLVIGLKYFLVQSLGSSIFLFSILWDSYSFGGWEWMMSGKEMGLVSCLSMMMKLGVFPFNGWMIHISENLSWKNFFLLSSIQEMIPLLMISKFGGSEKFVIFFLCVGVLNLVILCFSNYSIHWMMMISSLFNVCWMVMAAFLSKESLIFYFCVYFSILYVFFSMLEMVVSVGGLTSFSSYSIFKGGKIVFLFISFMIMGMPPFGSFLGKVEILSDMVNMGMMWVGLYFLIMSSIFMFLYLKVSLIISLVSKSGRSSGKVSYMMIMMMMGLSLIFFLIWMICSWSFYLKHWIFNSSKIFVMSLGVLVKWNVSLIQNIML